MDNDQKRVRSIFLGAVEDHAPERWCDYLDAACKGEPELRRRVEALLRGHRRPNSLLDDPGAAPVAPSPQSIGEGPGTLVGPYKLLEQIGEGGFGVVFMAEQQRPVRRKVALKIVKPGMDTRQVVARFEVERQALALMDHPNIAQIYDGGATESGRPFFAMELVRGIPITDFCDRHHLGLRGRLELFTHACRAVQHAHQKGVIHRDLKPSNIMVTQHDVTPVVKIIDFGIAKATGRQLTDKTLFTNFAQMIGTPMYMSPEQAQMSGLDVDTRSDVYSLGVVLYELMTGNTPFDRERLRTVAYDEMIRIIREEEPVRPSTRISTLGNAAKTVPIDRNCTPQKLSKLLRGELDWIVLKALEKDRNRRYESASALGDEVRRYLNDEPVLACPPSIGYRLRKTAGRHKVELATAAVVFAALTAGAALAVSQAVLATRAKQDALASAAAEKNAKIAAEAKEAEAQAVIDFLEKRVLLAARPEGYGGGLGHDVTLRRALEAALPYVQEGFKDQPLIEARLRMMMGFSFGRLADAPKSGEQYAAARDIYAKQFGPDNEFTLKCTVGLARSFDASGRHADGRELCAAALGKMQATIGPDHEETLNAMDCLAECHTSLGQFAVAFQLHERVLELRSAKLGPDDAHTLISRHNLAASHSRLGHRREALVSFEGLLPTMKEKFGRDDVVTLDCMNNLANEYQYAERHAHACKLREEVLALRTANLGPAHPLTLRAMRNLGISYRLGNRRAEGLQLCNEAWLLTAAKYGPDHSETLDCMNSVAWCHHALAQKESAIKFGRETLAKRKANPNLGTKHPSTLESMVSLGLFLSAAGQHDEALALQQEALTLRISELGDDHPETLNSRVNLAWCLWRLNRAAEVVPIIDDCIRRASKVDVKPNFVPELLTLRMRSLAKANDIAGCQATAAMWDTLGRTDSGTLFGAARAHALAAGMIRHLDTSGAAERQSKAEADLAMDWLRKAIAAGYRDSAENMARDPYLVILRDRTDYIKLMAELPPEPKKEEK